MEKFFSMIINAFGFKQCVRDGQVYVCLNCKQEYTNEGEGVLCEKCGAGS